MTILSARYDINGSSADGTLSTVEMRWQFNLGFVSVTFFSDAELTIPVTPSAGTITFEASEDGITYGSIANGAVDPTIQYDRPNFAGSAEFVRATCAGITGAPFYKATVFRSK